MSTKHGGLMAWALVPLTWPAAPAPAEVSANLLANPSFENGLGAGGVPVGWQPYQQRDEKRRLTLVDTAADGKHALLIEDDSPDAEIGISQTVPAKGGLGYRAAVRVHAAPQGTPRGAYLQMRFVPSGQMRQRSLTAPGQGFSEIQVSGKAPEGTAQITIYLYTHASPTPRLIVDQAELVSGVEGDDLADPPPPVPPTYDKLKDLCLTTDLVRDNQAQIAIIKPATGVHDAAANRIQQAVRQITGVTLPIVDDAATAQTIRTAVVEGHPARRPKDGKGPLPANLICLGNRSTSQTVSALYDLYYTLLDLKYPGPGGREVRSLHSPFGDGRNVIFVGGSEPAGVEAAADVLIEKLQAAGGKPGDLRVGRLMEIKLSDRYTVPSDIRQVQTWEASDMYRSVGYFGWNTISKRMALYYMTGDPHHAREALRLALPDEAAKKEIADIDGEMIENKDSPLSGPYHYNAHMMILFWDLIEESPVFSDAERLAVTNAFARQLDHRRDEGIYGLIDPPGMLGSRHGQWSAVSLYCLGRYFQTGYPHPVWRQCVLGGRRQFEALHESAYLYGEADNLYWYNTGIAPIFTYLVLTGDRLPLENGVVPELLRGQEILISGRKPDWALRGAALDFLHKAAYVTGDGRWIGYRQRTANDTDVFRVGQSFWPDETLAAKQPDDLVGKWTVNRLPDPAWHARHSGLPRSDSFYFAGFRSAADGTGDYILLDGYNGASRNPYHTFAILELRLAGRTVLRGAGEGQGYLNQVLTRADGMVEPAVAMDAALRHCDVVGGTAAAVAEVPNAAFCNWRRNLVQRISRYALIVDDLTFRTDSDNMEVETLWESDRLRWDEGRQVLSVSAADGKSTTAFICPCDPLPAKIQGGSATLTWRGAVRASERKLFFSLIGLPGEDPARPVACHRLTDNAAVLHLPEPGIAAKDEFQQTQGDLVVTSGSHLYGHGLVRAGLDAVLLSASAPIDVDWDFGGQRMEIAASQNVVLRLSRNTVSTAAQLDGKAIDAGGTGDFVEVALAGGRHVASGVAPAPEARKAIAERLAGLGQQALERRRQSPATATAPTEIPAIKPAWTAGVGGAVVDLATGVINGKSTVFAAKGKAVHVLTADGKELRRMETDGPIRVLRWWAETGLLLAGCADEKVIAFDAKGDRRWTFVSEMDPAVFRAAKQYWFKSAHPGIHGLHTGVFIEGKSQAFVGSACTLEILDEAGKLVRRMPVFWGPGTVFQIVDAPDGCRNLLVGRKPNDGHALAIINNRKLDPGPRGFDGVPAGHSYVGGWDAMSRSHIFYEDLDGDGAKEVASEINGVWNRLMVWNAAGRPLYNAQFGAGPDHQNPDLTMRDLDTADLDGDGKKEILVGLSRGLVAALNCRCEKVWARRLASPPVVVQSVMPAGGSKPRVVAGCEDGAVVVLDGAGTPIRRSAVDGRPAKIALTADDAGSPLVVVATTKGQVASLRLTVKDN